MMIASVCSTLQPATAMRPAPSCSRSPPPRLWTGETSASIEIAAPRQELFEAYADIERMTQWSPLLKSVELVDPAARLSEWSLRVPRPLARIVERAGMGEIVRWQAVHEVDPPHRLSWRSLDGVQNAGRATFESSDKSPDVTTLTLRMEYTLPDVAKPLLESELAQRFVRRTMLATMERFRDALESGGGVKGEPPAAAAARPRR